MKNTQKTLFQRKNRTDLDEILSFLEEEMAKLMYFYSLKIVLFSQSLIFHSMWF